MTCIELTSVRELPEWAAKNHGMFFGIFCVPVYIRTRHIPYMSETLTPETTYSLWLGVIEVCRG